MPSSLAEKISLGTAAFAAGYGATRGSSAALDGDDVIGLLATAWEAGVRHLDTAPDYGDAERLLGTFGRQVGLADWKISTKIKLPPNEKTDVRRWVHREIERSMGHLGVDRLSTVFLHRPEVATSPSGEEVLAALVELRDSGGIGAIGASVYGPDELGPLFSVGRFDVVQAPVSIVDRRMLAPEVTRLLQENGCKLEARSVFLQGLLLASPSARPGWARSFDGALSPWDVWAAAQDATSGADRARICLGWALEQGEITRAVVGVESAEQLTALVNGQARTGSATVPDAVVVDDLTVIDPRRWPRRTPL